MDNEVSHALEIAVSMMAMAVIIGVIVGTVIFGRSIREGGYSYMLQVNDDMSSSFLKSLEGVYDEMPSAAAYNILKANSDSITRVECKICKTTESGRVENHCIATHLKGKVSLDVVRDGSGEYSIVIHKDSCTWGTKGCTC